MTPSVVLSDMDGTFLSTDKSIPLVNQDALDELASVGVPFVPCSGRARSGVVRGVIEHPATRYAVCANGASIYRVDHSNGEVALAPLRETYFPKAAALRLFSILEGCDMQFDVFADGVAWVNERRFSTMGEFVTEPEMLSFIRSNRRAVPYDVPQIVESAHRVERLHLSFKDRATCEQMMGAVDAIEGICYLTPERDHLEVCVEGANKGTALKWLCEHEGLDLSRSVAFGDGGNDVEMILSAGLGVAMSNASDDCRDAADYVCASNDEGGVGRVIIKLLECR